MGPSTICPGCEAEFRLPPGSAGRKLRCARCRYVFVVTAVGSDSAAGASRTLTIEPNAARDDTLVPDGAEPGARSRAKWAAREAGAARASGSSRARASDAFGAPAKRRPAKADPFGGASYEPPGVPRWAVWAVVAFGLIVVAGGVSAYVFLAYDPRPAPVAWHAPAPPAAPLVPLPKGPKAAPDWPAAGAKDAKVAPPWVPAPEPKAAPPARPAPPADPEPAIPANAGELRGDGELTGVGPIRSFKAPGNVAQVLFSPRHRRLFLRNSGSNVRVLDSETGAALGTRPATDQFTDMALSPDESTLFVADFGGEATGYGTPVRPNHVHRYAVAADRWDSEVAPKIAFRVAAVDAERLLLLESDQWIDVSLNRWDKGGLRELTRQSAERPSPVAYDPATRRLYVASSGAPQAIRVGTDAFRAGGGVAGRRFGHAEGGPSGTISALSADGSRLYLGKQQVEALDLTHLVRTFPEPMVAASRDLAFADEAYYDARTGEKLGKLPFKSDVRTFSPDGRVMWAFDAASTTLHAFSVGPRGPREPAGAEVARAVPAPALPAGPRRTRLTAVRTLPVPGSTVKPAPADPFPLAFRPPGQAEHGPQIAVSAKHKRTLVRTAARLIVLDAATGRVVADRTPRQAFTDMALTPDESAVFLADGTALVGGPAGYGFANGEVGRVHRYGLTDDSWKSDELKGPIARLEALDDRRFVGLGGRGRPGLCICRWDAGGVSELFRNENHLIDGTDLLFEPRTGRLRFAHSLTSLFAGATFRLDGDSFAPAAGGRNIGRNMERLQARPGTNPPTLWGTIALSTDGSTLYNGQVQREADDPESKERVFPVLILAATRDLAFGGGAYYDAQTGEKLGRFPFDAAAFAPSADGASLWVFDAAGGKAHEYRIDEPGRGPAPAAAANDAAPEEPEPPVEPDAGTPKGDGKLYKLTPVRQIRVAGMPKPEPEKDHGPADFAPPRPIARPHIAASKKFDRLFVRTTRVIRVYEMGTGVQKDIRTPKGEFSDIALSPDESALFAADFGGEEIGYVKPTKPSWVHRYDLKTGQWAAHPLDGIAFRLEAVDARRFLLLTSDQHVRVRLCSWGDGAVSERPAARAGYFGDIAYDPRTRQLFHGSCGSTANCLQALTLEGDDLFERQKAPEMYGNTQEGGGSIVASPDGSRLYYGRLQVSTTNLRTNIIKFPEIVYAATRDLALTERAVYHAHTGRKLGRLPFATKVYAVSGDGTTVWALDQVGGAVHEYVISQADGPPRMGDDVIGLAPEAARQQATPPATAPRASAPKPRTPPPREALEPAPRLAQSLVFDPDVPVEQLAALNSPMILVTRGGERVRVFHIDGSPLRRLDIQATGRFVSMFASQMDAYVHERDPKSGRNRSPGS